MPSSTDVALAAGARPGHFMIYLTRSGHQFIAKKHEQLS